MTKNQSISFVGAPSLPKDGQKPPKDLSSWGAWERRQSAIEDRMPELGLGPPFLKISYTLAAYPIKALIRVRHQMKSTRQVRDMLYGPTSDDESSRGEG